MTWAAAYPQGTLGFLDEVWWSRFAQPALHTWCAEEPLRLVEKQPVKDDPDPKAIACYGLYQPTTHRMRLRFVHQRPVSAVTCAFLAWLLQELTTEGHRALFLVWDNASWHISAAVRHWVRTYNRHAKQHGHCRLIVCQLPVKSPWLNPIEPKWRHGKRAVVEPVRLLTADELTQRICDYYDCERLAPITQLDC